MNFTTKKRARKDAWKDLQKDLEEREHLEDENTTKFAHMDALRGRTALGESVTAAIILLFKTIHIRATLSIQRVTRIRTPHTATWIF